MIIKFNTYFVLPSNNNTGESISFVVAEITFKVAMMTASVAKITLAVSEMTFKGPVITSSMVKITFVVTEITC